MKNFTVIITALRSLGDYFSQEANTTLKNITEKQTGLEEGEMSYIVTVKQQIDDLLSKLKALKSISPLSFRDDGNVEEKLNALKINISLFDRFNSDKTNEVVNSINSSLDTVLQKVGQLKGEVGKQKGLVKKLIEKYKTNINSFLVNAGYRYTIEIKTDDKKNYKLLLRHIDSTGLINGGKQYLSYGERNAFSLVLFMYEALSKNADLIILDDPISSFDKNKKYAIMHMLFRGESDKCFKNKTVLMLTHDIDPVIDTTKVLKEFGNLSESKFISCRGGVLSEQNIEKSDVLTFSQICKKTMESDLNDIIKLIYLRRRFEIIDNSRDEYQVISNLLHKRRREDCTDQRKEKGNDLMDDAVFSSGICGIRAEMPNFDYDSLLDIVNDQEALKRIYSETNKIGRAHV